MNTSVRLAILVLLLARVIIAAETPTLASLTPQARAEAVRAMLAPTTIELPAGRISLAAAITALGKDGNRVVLADRVDDRAEAELPAVNAPWWEAVRVICTAFSLRFDAGIPGNDVIEGDGEPLPIGHGTLVLSADPTGPPRFAVAGSVAVAIDTKAILSGDANAIAVRAWARAEPRLPHDRLAWARATARLDPVPRGQLRLGAGDEEEEADGGNRIPGATWTFLAPTGSDPSTLAVVLTLRLAPVEGWSLRTILKPGETSHIDVNGQTVLAALLVDKAKADWEGLPLPDRRPLVAISGPMETLASARSRLRSNDIDLPSRGSNNGASSGRINRFMFLADELPQNPLELVLDGSSTILPQSQEVRIPLLHARTDEACDPDLPARLEWQAATAPLSRWLTALAATGNSVLPEVGIDTAVPVAMPAVAGSFWDGVLALCRAADLTPAIEPGSAIASGPVRLLRRNGKPLLAAACGPLLCVATTPESTDPGTGREVRVRVAFIAEPRIGTDRYGQPTVAWGTFATSQDGTAFPITAQAADQHPDSGNRQVVQMGAQMRVVMRQGGMVVVPATADGGGLATSGPSTTIRLGAATVRSLVISGMVVVPRARILRASVDAVVNEAAEAILFDRPIEVKPLTAAANTSGGISGQPGILLRGTAGLDDLALTVTKEDGTALDANNLAPRNRGGRDDGSRLAWCRIPNEGHLSVEVTAKEAKASLYLPLRLDVVLP